jgi:hypothetical protein
MRPLCAVSKRHGGGFRVTGALNPLRQFQCRSRSPRTIDCESPFWARHLANICRAKSSSHDELPCKIRRERAEGRYFLEAIASEPVNSIRAETKVPRVPGHPQETPQNCAEHCTSPTSCSSLPALQRRAGLNNPLAFFRFSRVLSLGGGFKIGDVAVPDGTVRALNA